MKKIIQFFSLFTFALIVSAATVNAQTAKSVDANVPFNFTVGNETYAAGTYKLQVISDSAGGSLVTINDDKGNTLQTVVATQNGAAAVGKSELVFERRGNERYLVCISLPERGLQFANSKRQRAEISRNTSSEPKVKKG
jgi:hypothetical protein